MLRFGVSHLPLWALRACRSQIIAAFQAAPSESLMLDLFKGWKCGWMVEKSPVKPVKIIAWEFIQPIYLLDLFKYSFRVLRHISNSSTVVLGPSRPTFDDVGTCKVVWDWFPVVPNLKSSQWPSIVPTKLLSLLASRFEETWDQTTMGDKKSRFPWCFWYMHYLFEAQVKGYVRPVRALGSEDGRLL